jgi:hypothetical protein
MEALRSAWQYTPMSDIQGRQFLRLFAGYPTEVVRAVFDDLIAVGTSRPGPAEMGELFRGKMGKRPPGGRAQKPGPFLEPVPEEERLDEADLHLHFQHLRALTGRAP